MTESQELEPGWLKTVFADVQRGPCDEREAAIYMQGVEDGKAIERARQQANTKQS